MAPITPSESALPTGRYRGTAPVTLSRLVRRESRAHRRHTLSKASAMYGLKSGLTYTNKTSFFHGMFVLSYLQVTAR